MGSKNFDLKNSKFTISVKNNDLIMQDHLIHGVRIMPSISFIDAIYRYLISKNIDTSELKLKKIYCLEPIATSNDFNSKMQISVANNKSSLKVLGRSSKVSPDNEALSDWIDNFHCTVEYSDAVSERTIDIKELRFNAQVLIDMDEIYVHSYKAEVEHLDFIQSKGHVYETTQYIFGQLYLSDQSIEFLDYFHLHPAYLDSASSVLYGLDNFKFFSDKPFVPIYIEEFQAFDKLKRACNIYIDQASVIKINPDTIKLDIDIFDGDGKHVIFIKGLYLKKVSSPDLITKYASLDKFTDDTIKTYKEQATSIFGQSGSVMENIVKDVKASFSSVLEISPDDISTESEFYGLGLNSVQMLNYVIFLEKRLKVTLSPTLLFELETVGNLITHLNENYSDQYEELIKSSVPNITFEFNEDATPTTNMLDEISSTDSSSTNQLSSEEIFDSSLSDNTDLIEDFESFNSEDDNDIDSEALANFINEELAASDTAEEPALEDELETSLRDNLSSSEEESETISPDSSLLQNYDFDSILDSDFKKIGKNLR
jgi:acyl carrier protein